MKRMIWTVVIAFVLIAPHTALAGPMEADTAGYNYWRIISTAGDTALLDPDPAGNAWTGYTKGTPPAGQALGANQWLVLGRGNYEIDSNRKIIDVHITCGANATLERTNAHWGYAVGPTQSLVVWSTNTGTAYDLHWILDPQPQWEWVALKNTGPATTLSTVRIESYCESKMATNVKIQCTGSPIALPEQVFLSKNLPVRFFLDVSCTTVTVTFTGGPVAIPPFTLSGAGDSRKIWFTQAGSYSYSLSGFLGDKAAAGTVEVRALDAVPSLTTWGMASLLLTLTATALWVLRKRRVNYTT